jgi:hypothetical protein
MKKKSGEIKKKSVTEEGENKQQGHDKWRDICGHYLKGSNAIKENMNSIVEAQRIM